MKIIGHYILRSTGDDDYILVPERGSDATFTGLCSLNSTGVFVWKNIEKRKSAGEISRLAAKKYNVSKETAERDINAFLECLSDIGILEI